MSETSRANKQTNQSASTKRDGEAQHAPWNSTTCPSGGRGDVPPWSALPNSLQNPEIARSLVVDGVGPTRQCHLLNRFLSSADWASTSETTANPPYPRRSLVVDGGSPTWGCMPSLSMQLSLSVSFCASRLFCLLVCFACCAHFV